MPSGAYLYDSAGKRYIDYVGSWGPMILGHAHPDVITAVKQAAEKGLSFGAPTEIETLMARRVCELMPSIELVRMVQLRHRSYHERHSFSQGLYRPR